MPLSAAATQTLTSGLTPTVVSPTDNYVVTVTLKFNGVNFSPEGLRAALDAAYGTVSLETDHVRKGGPYRYLIQP